MTLKTSRINKEVLFAKKGVVKISCKEISSLKQKAMRNSRKRIRLCVHNHAADSVHEMIIVHKKGCYVRPHKHTDKFESFHVIEGQADLFLFSDDGGVKEFVRLGDCASGRRFYCRIPEGVFHSIVICSDWLVFKETASGPFMASGMVYAKWSPEGGDSRSCARFIKRLYGKGRHAK
jgi:cupin fold WbuC family metalloprotein